MVHKLNSFSHISFWEIGSYKNGYSTSLNKITVWLFYQCTTFSNEIRNGINDSHLHQSIFDPQISLLQSKELVFRVRLGIISVLNLRIFILNFLFFQFHDLWFNSKKSNN